MTRAAASEDTTGRASSEWPRHGVSFGEALRTWARVGLLSFGGPAAQIAVMHRVLVDEKRWIGEDRFLHALNFCMLLPGPEATQLATYVGWLMHRTKGGLAAGILFILPGFVAIMALSIVYALYHRTHLVDAIFYGIKPAVLAIVAQAVIRIGSRALRTPTMRTIAACSFIAIFFLHISFPAIVAAALLVGLLGASARHGLFRTNAAHGASHAHAQERPPLLPDDAVLPVSRSPFRAVRVTLLGLVLWLGPLWGVMLLFGRDSVLAESGLFFSKAALVTFGGAYAVLGYVAQHAPEVGWLQPGEMLDGLGMAETTPGPLIMVLQFVGFMAGYRDPASTGAALELSPLLSGILGATLATWVTFAPCFLWIFVGAPYMERLRHSPRLGDALGCVTAAVVGVVLNLAVWFTLNTVFARGTSPRRAGPFTLDVPVWDSFDPFAALLAGLALVLVFKLRWGLLAVIASSATAGAAVFAARVAWGWNPG